MSFRVSLRRCLICCCILLSSVILSARGQNGTSAGNSSALAPQATATSAPSKPSTQAPAVGVYRGTLGTGASLRSLQLNLELRQDDIDGLEGHYFVFGDGRKIEVAGELEGNTLWLEESVNGSDVSGEWNGTWQNGEWRGIWKDANGEREQSFVLKRQ